MQDVNVLKHAQLLLHVLEACRQEEAALVCALVHEQPAGQKFEAGDARARTGRQGAGARAGW